MNTKPELDTAVFVDLLNTLAARGLLEVFDPRTGKSVRIASARLDLPVVQFIVAEPSDEGGER